MRRILAAVGAITIGLGLSGCGTSDHSQSEHSSADKNKTIRVVASTNVWGAIAQAIGGNEVNVESIITSPTQDPHEYEASAKDKLEFSKAQLVIYNGGGYDDWAKKLLDSNSNKPEVVEAFAASGLKTNNDADKEEKDEHDHDHEHGDHDHDHGKHEHEHNHEVNEHVFYSISGAKSVATQIANHLTKISPDHKAEFQKNLEQFNKKIDDLKADVIHYLHQNKNIKAVATESVADYLLADLGIENLTPEEYVEESETEAGPSAKLVKEMQDLIANKKVQMLVVNGQTEDAVSKRLKDAAKSAGIQIVDVTETLPEGVSTYYDFINRALQKIKR